MRKRGQILSKLRENHGTIFATILRKFQRKFVGILRNFYKNFEDVWKLRKFSRKLCGKFIETWQSICGDQEKFGEKFIDILREFCKNFKEIVHKF